MAFRRSRVRVPAGPPDLMNILQQFPFFSRFQISHPLIALIPVFRDEGSVFWGGEGFAGPFQSEEILCVCREEVRTLNVPKPEDERFYSFFAQDSVIGCGWLTYEAGMALNPCSVHPPVPQHLAGWWGIPDIILCRKGNEGILYARVPDLIRKCVDRLKSVQSRTDEISTGGKIFAQDFPNFEAYESAIRQVHSLIRAGECYQLNLTQRMRFQWDDDPWVLFVRLIEYHPTPWSCYWQDGNRAILSNSPEYAILIDGKAIRACPMKGTRPASGDDEDDLVRACELRSSEKDRAENLMIVDLWRNDLSRVCEVGTVRVPELFRIEFYPTVIQMVTPIEGILRHDIGLNELLRATFPSGSVTGAPKVRAMECLAEIERSPRGIYCGMLGIHGPGFVRWNVAIRTAWWENGTGYYGTGGGIVIDSVPHEEWEEMGWKISAFRHILLNPNRA